MGGRKNGTTAEKVSPFSNESRNAYVVEHLTSSMLELLKELKHGGIYQYD